MTLQKKIVLVFVTLGALFAIGTNPGLHAVVLPAFEEFELTSAQQSLTRIHHALDAEMRALEVFNREYSEWDHTYDFALGRRDEYVEENLDVSYWESVNIEMMLYYDLDGQLMWGKVLDPSHIDEVPIEQELFQSITPDHPLLQHQDTYEPILGILQARTAPLLVSSLPILTSSRDGSPAGTLITGRYLDSALINELADSASVELALHSRNESRNSQAVMSEFEAAGEHENLTHWHYGEEALTGHHIMTDVFGVPAFRVDLRMPRSIIAIGHSTIDAAMIFLLTATAVFLLSSWLFMRHLIVAPVATLTQHMLRIRETGNLDHKLESDRSDEIGLLTQEFGQLTSKLGGVQRELETARDKALALSDAKSEFLARMSHEIRTPMNGVLGMVELLDGTLLNDTQKRYALTIRDSADSLLDIINDVLDFSKIEAGKLRLEKVLFDLNAFLTETVDNLEHLAREKGLNLECQLPAGSALAVCGDPFRMRQILTNLIANGIKFTDSGSVILRVTAMDDDAEHMNLCFEVIDTGIGIVAEKQNLIFDSFAQEDGSTTRRFGGTGLGLSICKQLIEMMDGKLCVQSEPGKGSVFSFRLRMKASSGTEFSASARSLQKDILTLKKRTATIKALRGRVLLAEDNLVNQEVAQGLLASIGLEAVVAKTGNEAIEQFLCNTFDAVLMDCQMPELDGYQATQAIRQLETESNEDPVAIIAVTANALAGDREKCVAAGMNDYLSKPFTGEQLYRVLSKYLQHNERIAIQETSDHMAQESVTPEFDDQPSSASIDASVLDGLSELQEIGSHNLVQRVVQAYLESSEELAMQLHAAIDSADAESVAKTVHTLKSSSANVGALKLAGLCKTLEAAGRQSDLSMAAELHQQIQQEYEQVIDALKLRMKAMAA